MAVGKSNFAYCSTASGTYTEVPARLIKSIKPKADSLASEESGRTDDGVMHITWVKSNLRKWEITLNPCTAAELSSILNAVQGKVYYVNIFDVYSNNVVQHLHVYTSNTESDCYSGVLYGGLYQDASFSIIEIGD